MYSSDHIRSIQIRSVNGALICTTPQLCEELAARSSHLLDELEITPLLEKSSDTHVSG